MSVALTSSVNYTLKPTSVKCNRRQIVIPCSNKTSFTAGETAVFYLPSLSNQVMDGQSGYMRFTATITDNGYLDNSAQSFIDRIQTYAAGGQLISDIQQYSVLAAMMTDLQLSQSEKIGLSGTLGTEDDYGSTTVTTALTASGPLAQDYFATYPGAGGLAQGDPFAPVTATSTPTLTNSNRKGMALTDGEPYTFCIPLLHPIFTLSEKYWPAFALSDDTRLEITWNSVLNALVSSTAFTITNPEIIVDMIEFDSSVFPMIQQTYSGSELIIPAQDYHYYASMIAAGTTGNISQIIPAKQQSARAMFFTFRPAETQAAAGYSVSSRVNPFYSVGDQFNLNVGGMKVPQHPIRTRIAGNHAEWFASTQTALHAFNSLDMNGSLNRSYYGATSAQAGHLAGANSYRNGFCLGLNLDSLRGQSQTQNSGISLANITTYYEGYIGTAPKATGGGDENVTVDCFLLHDCLYVVAADGTMSVRW